MTNKKKPLTYVIHKYVPRISRSIPYIMSTVPRTWWTDDNQNKKRSSYF